jgi:predicted phosphoribosyltransferase
LAIPAGGVPVAVEIARATGWSLDVAVVSKITLPWNSEAGYGAVAYDGTVRLNEPFLAQLGMAREQITAGIAQTRIKVERRKRRLRGGDGMPVVEGCTAILVDDGLASGFTMEVAVEAVRRQGAARVVVAAPTGHDKAVQRLAECADDVVCANVRSSLPFAVADAYERWQDVPEVLADELLRPFRARDRPWAKEE